MSPAAHRAGTDERRPEPIVGFGATRAHAGTGAVEPRVSGVASPRPSDQLTIGDETLVTQGAPAWRDPDRLVSPLDARPA